jgi:hypothetical protein
MKSKSKLGQFYTTNYRYILQSFTIPEGTTVIEPFAGNGDLLEFVDITKNTVECYDIDPKKESIMRRDTLMNPPGFSGKFVLTNPPYLARNKNTVKEIYDKYNCNDLYKCFIEIIIQDNCIGGILIVPLNFISSIRAADIDLRKRFLSVYQISHMNIFEEQVFNDTSYTVCSFQFVNRRVVNDISTGVLCTIYPQKKELSVELNSSNNYTIGGEIYNLPVGHLYKIDRATKNTEKHECITNILAKCIDDSIDKPIQLKIVGDAERYIDNTPNLSARSYASLVIDPPLSMEMQNALVFRFNKYLNENREKYNSLFLTNYRESTTIARKRISFHLVFQICNYLLNTTDA